MADRGPARERRYDLWLEFGEQAMIPVNVIFSPDWWNRRFGVSFEEPFYLDVETRIANDVLMRRPLYELFGIGEPDPQPRPIIGSLHVAGGFVIPALLGARIRFDANAAPTAEPDQPQLQGNAERYQCQILHMEDRWRKQQKTNRQQPVIHQSFQQFQRPAQPPRQPRQPGHYVHQSTVWR